MLLLVIFHNPSKNILQYTRLEAQDKTFRIWPDFGTFSKKCITFSRPTLAFSWRSQKICDFILQFSKSKSQEKDLAIFFSLTVDLAFHSRWCKQQKTRISISWLQLGKKWKNIKWIWPLFNCINWSIVDVTSPPSF